MGKRKSPESYSKEFSDLHGENLSLLSIYVSAYEKVEVRCNSCKNIWKPKACEIVRKRIKEKNLKCCPYCKQSNHSKNIESKERFYRILNSNKNNLIKMIGSYTTGQEEVLFKCSVHGEFKQKPSHIAQGRGCNKCSYDKISKSKIKNPMSYRKEFERVSDGEYLMLSEYKDGYTKIRVRHLKCGLEYEVNPRSFLQGRRCGKCAKNQKLSDTDFIAKFKENCNDEYELLSQYEGSLKYITVRHRECGNIYEVKPGDFTYGYRCRPCSYKKLRKSREEFKREFDLSSEGEYILLSEYEKSTSKISVKHMKCGKDYKVIASSFLGGSRCPFCTKIKSKGEISIMKFLDSKDTTYIAEYSNRKLKIKNTLKFDYFIGSLLMVEYDGGQHFFPVEYFGGKRTLEEVIKRDKIKNQYCIDNNIPLIRIPYWEFDNMESILTSVLSHYNLLNSEEEYDKELFKEFLVDENWVHDDYIAKCPKNNKKVKEENK